MYSSSPQHGPGPVASSSTSSANEIARQDQIVHRFYIKHVEVLTDARLTHFNGPSVGGGAATSTAVRAGERLDEDLAMTGEEGVKIDKWFGINLPDYELFRSDLAVYQKLSNFYPPSSSHPLPAPGSATPLTDSQFAQVPPLLLVFILDASDVSAKHAIVYEREDGHRFRVDLGRKLRGIVLERWTLETITPHSEHLTNVASGNSDKEPLSPVWPNSSTSYRAGVNHFRNVYDHIRTMPAYSLYRRLKRNNLGLKIGVKLWSTDSPDWAVMEKDLLAVDAPISAITSPLGTNFPAGHLAKQAPTGKSAQTHQNHFRSHTFPPVQIANALFSLSYTSRTAANFLVEDLDTVLSSALEAMDLQEDYFSPSPPGPSSVEAYRPRVPSGLTPPTSNIPSRGQAIEGLGSSSSSLNKYGPIGEGLPFAVATGGSSALVPGVFPRSTSSPIPTSMPRRRSSLAMQEPSSSTSPSGLGFVQRSSPLSARSMESRPRSYLSQSGRSFTQINEARPRLQSLLSSSHSPRIPSSLSPTMSRPRLATQASSPTPPIPESNFEGDPSRQAIISKRYSSSFGKGSRFGTPSSGDPGSLMESSLRRTASRNSTSNRMSSVVQASDSEDINSFLRTLESLPRPSSMTAASSTALRTPAQSTPSSESSRHAPSESDRRRLTRNDVEDTLKRMADSFSLSSPAFSPRMDPLPSPRRSSPSSAGMSGAPSRERSCDLPEDPSPRQAVPGGGINPSRPLQRIVQSLPVTTDPMDETRRPSSSGGTSSNSDRRRAPVLLRGGFQQFAPSSPMRDPIMSSASSPARQSSLSRDSDRPRSRSQAPRHDEMDCVSDAADDKLHEQESLRRWTRKLRPVASDGAPTAPSSYDSRDVSLGLGFGPVPPLSARPQSQGVYREQPPQAEGRRDFAPDDESIVGNMELSRG